MKTANMDNPDPNYFSQEENVGRIPRLHFQLSI